VQDKGRRPGSVIVGGESPVSHAGGLLVETARCSGLGKHLSSRLRRWGRPLAVHDPGKIVGPRGRGGSGRERRRGYRDALVCPAQDAYPGTFSQRQLLNPSGWPNGRPKLS